MINTRAKLTVSLTVVAMVLGLMISLQYRQTSGNNLSNFSWHTASSEQRRLEAELSALKNSNAAAEQQLAVVTTEIANYEKASAGSNAALVGMQARVEDERILAGSTPVRGPGVTVTLMDGVSVGSNTEQALTHDWDVRSVINELFTAGAEAVSINGFRVVATSGIFCTGPVVKINSHRMGAPFQIEAIGDAGTLKSALDLQGGILDALRARGVNVSEPQIQGVITIPAFTGDLTGLSSSSSN